MIIDLERRYVFVHIPKTAGTSIRAALGPTVTRGQVADEAHQHATAAEIRAEFWPDRDGRESTLLWWAVVRNPWDLVHSDWYFVRNHVARMRRDQWLQQELAEPFYMDLRMLDDVADHFGEFVRFKYGPGRCTGTWRYWCQSAGDDLVDCALRFDRLAADFDPFMQRLGVPVRYADLGRLNQTTRPPYREEFDAATKDVVARAFAFDLKKFGWEF